MTPYSQWRRATAGGIKYKLIEGPTGSFDDSGDASFQEVYVLRAEDLLPFVVESLPLPSLSGTTIIWGVPRLLPGSTAIYTKSINFEAFTGGRPTDPFSADAGASDGTYDPYVKVTITYKPETRKDEDDPETFLTVTARASAEYLTIGNRGEARWEGGGPLRDPNVPIAHVVSETEWEIAWPRVPNNIIPVLFNRCRPFMGHVNSGELDLIHDAPAETVLFTGMSFDESFNAGGSSTDEQKCGQVSITFLEKRIAVEGDDGPFGHNHFFNPEENEYQRVVKKDGSYVHPEADLNSLFS